MQCDVSSRTIPFYDVAVKSLLFALVVAATTILPQTPVPTHMPSDIRIYAIRRDGKSLSIDPVVIVHYEGDQRFKTIPAFNNPLPENPTNADFDRIENLFYKVGTPVTLFYGGAKLGTATVSSSNIEGRDGGCVDLSASIAYEGTQEPALAASTTSEIPGHVANRRAATTQEVSILRQLSTQWLIEYGLDQQLVRHGTMGKVVSTELRRNAGRALIARFDVVGKRAIFRLFVVGEPKNGRYSLTLTDLEIQHDMEDGVDQAEREYVDQLDIDNDGVDEVITSATHYETWSYTIWRFDAKQGRWQNAYEGLGGGC